MTWMLQLYLAEKFIVFLLQLKMQFDEKKFIKYDLASICFVSFKFAWVILNTKDLNMGGGRQ